MEHASSAPKKRLTLEITGRQSGLGAGGVIKSAVKNRKPKYHGYTEAGKALISEEITSGSAYQRDRGNSTVAESVIGPQKTTNRYIFRAAGSPIIIFCDLPGYRAIFRKYATERSRGENLDARRPAQSMRKAERWGGAGRAKGSGRRRVKLTADKTAAVRAFVEAYPSSHVSSVRKIGGGIWCFEIDGRPLY